MDDYAQPAILAVLFHIILLFVVSF